MAEKQTVNKQAVDQQPNEVTIYIDNEAYQVSKDDNLLANVLSQKLNLPYFCWHPSMGSVGACRQCAVTQFQDENDTRGRIVMSCMTPVSDGMRIGLQDTSSAKFREQVIAAMMTNHPHDCPVCAEGGECHLQDMTVMTGHSSRQYQGSKRTFTNQYLGEFVGHEMNRCITCYRCVRFYQDYAGGKDFGVYGSKNQVYFGRQNDGALESEFSGNLVEVCPTGVFTNKLFSAHYTRKWDLQSSPSVCTHCSVGCNISMGERYGSVRRVMNRYNPDINGYFLCDRGRFGIGFVNSEQRIRKAKGISQLSPDHLSSLDVSKALVHFKHKKFIGIGSGRASLEANAYLKMLVGAEHFSLGYNNTQMAMAAEHLVLFEHYTMATLAEIEQSDFVLVIGEDISQTSPRVALSIRQALRNVSFEKAAKIGIPHWQDEAVRTCGGKQLTPLYLLNTVNTKLDDVSVKAPIMSVQQIEQGLLYLTDLFRKNIEDDVEVSNHTLIATPIITEIFHALSKAKKPLIVSGWSHQSPSLLKAINDLMKVLFAKKDKQLNLVITPDESNSMGLMALMDEHSLSIEQVVAGYKDVSGVVILENALNQLTLNEQKTLRDNTETLIVIEHSEHELTNAADIVMPSAPISEDNGHYVNYQGAIQPYTQALPSVLPVQESWRWLVALSNVITSASELSSFSSLTELQQILNKNFGFEFSALHKQEQTRKFARQTHRASGRTAQMANISVHELKSTQTNYSNQSESTGFAFSMEGLKPTMANEIPYAWSPGWNSNQAISQFQVRVGGKLIHSSTTNKLHIKGSEKRLSGWRRNDFVHTRKLDLVRKYYWYDKDWQGQFNPEFTMLEKENTLTVSPQTAMSNSWEENQYLQLVFKTEVTANDHFIFRLIIDKNLPSDPDTDHGIIQCSLLPTHFNLSNFTFIPADKIKIESYRQFHLSRMTDAKERKTRQLSTLKSQDQYIPIRLVAGGLDDY